MSDAGFEDVDKRVFRASIISTSSIDQPGLQLFPRPSQGIDGEYQERVSQS